LIDKINNTLSDPEEMEAYRDNLLCYTSVMANGKFKIQNYLDAVRYVSLKLLGATNISAYERTFPDKMTRFLAQGVAPKDIASYITAYNKSKLVNLIYEQTLVPTHVLNADLYQKALNTQAELMTSASSEKVRTDAANSILTHLKRPETQKFELDIGIKQDSAIAELAATTRKLAEQQMKIIQSGGMTAQDVAHSGLVIDGECT
jgi:hypothetical protein